MTATVSVRFDDSGQATVQSYVRLTASTHIQCSTNDDARAHLVHPRRRARHHDHRPRQGRGHQRPREIRPQLADAVTPYAAELATIAARNRPAAPGRGPCRAGSVMVTQIKAGRPELVPPAAPGLSPATGKKEVNIVMRRVVTGEQVAQIYNPDPFARPVFRAPVYRTPAGIILIAWIVRGLARRAAAGLPAPGSRRGRGRAGVLVGQHRLDRLCSASGLGRAGAGDLVALLAGGLRPVGGHACAQQVAGLGVPPQVGRGNQHRRPGPLLPGPDHLAGAGQGHLHPVRRPGIRPAGVRPVRRRLR